MVHVLACDCYRGKLQRLSAVLAPDHRDDFYFTVERKAVVARRHLHADIESVSIFPGFDSGNVELFDVLGLHGKGGSYEDDGRECLYDVHCRIRGVGIRIGKRC